MFKISQLNKWFFHYFSVKIITVTNFNTIIKCVSASIYSEIIWVKNKQNNNTNQTIPTRITINQTMNIPIPADKRVISNIKKKIWIMLLDSSNKDIINPRYFPTFIYGHYLEHNTSPSMLKYFSDITWNYYIVFQKEYKIENTNTMKFHYNPFTNFEVSEWKVSSGTIELVMISYKTIQQALIFSVCQLTEGDWYE